MSSERDAAVKIGAVHFGDQGFQDGRAGRNFGDLDAGAEAIGDGLKARPDLFCDLVALERADVFRFEIDLDVGDVRPAAQVIVADQAVEVVRTRGAGVGLEIHDFGLLRGFLRQCLRDSRGFFQGGSVGHVDDDLELALVVKGEHLHLDESEIEQRAGAEQQHDNAQEEHAADQGTM